MCKEKIEELTTQIRNAMDSYYKDSVSIMSDIEFDKKIKELEALENEFPEFSDLNSPTKRVGSDLSQGFSKVSHDTPMISIHNVYSIQEAMDFVNNTKKEFNDPNLKFTAEIKIDGVSLGLRYRKGILVQAITRGDGSIGDDVTENAKTIMDIPLGISYTEDIEIRGECNLLLSQFEILNSWSEKHGEKIYQNARNAASGILKTKDSREVSKKGLSFRVFGTAELVNECNTQNELMDFIQNLGFKNINKAISFNTFEELEKICASIGKGRSEGKIPFPVDGVVIKVDDFLLREKMGWTNKDVRWARAYKFESEQATTRLLYIIYQVGRTGKITPVAEIEPAYLMGTTTRRATLHNIDEIHRLDLHDGDLVILEKGGDIIPKIVGVVLEARDINSNPVKIIDSCPECGAPLVKIEGQVDSYCSGIDCPAKLINKFKNFVSRKCMNVMGVGESLLEKLIEKGSINDLLDLYKLIPLDFTGIEGMGPKSIGSALDAIDASLKMIPPKLLAGLGVPKVGTNTASKIMEVYNSWDLLWEAKEEDLLKIKEISGISVKNLCKWREENPDFLEKIRALGMKMAFTPLSKSEGPLKGHIIVVSGTMSVEREELHRIIKVCGGRASSSVSGKTTLLVVGEGAGSKVETAQQLGVKIISEEDLRLMIGDFPIENTEEC